MTSLSDQLLQLGGGDPFAWVRQRSDAHQREHGCGLYNAGGPVMQLVASLARIANARRIADLGSGLGYSTLWLANAAGPASRVVGIDADPDHVAEARVIASEAALEGRVEYITGWVDEVLPTLDGPFDLIHDDAWFAREPNHLDTALRLLRPGGVLTMANWFLLVDALTHEPRNDWEQFAGPTWADDTLEYASSLAHRQGISVNWVTTPPVGIVTKSETTPATATDA